MKLRFFVSLVSLCSGTALTAAPLVNHGDDWRYFKGSVAPQANWQTVDGTALDAAWLTGPGGFGYADGDDATDLGESDIDPIYSSVYIRQEFTVTAGDFSATEKLILTVDYDDGFVAYLDGVEIARSSTAPGTAGTEPAFDDTATDDHEASSGNSSAQAPDVVDLGLATSLLSPGTHLLALIGFNDSLDSSDLSLIPDLSTQEPPPPLHWTLADSPVTLGSTYTVSSGQTLIIDAGVEVICPSGTNAINCAGVIQANGTEANPIRFIPTSPTGTWGRLNFTGPAESSLAYCDFERANSSGIIEATNSDIRLDHCRFIDVNVQMVDLVSSSCDIQHCEFDSISGAELLHFSNMPASGHALIAYNQFGIPGVPAAGGYNDVIDFTGGNRPGPIVRFIGNVFLSGADDVFDMDGTDAHIEGNVFFDVIKEAARSSSANPITTGADGSRLSELVIARNFFVNCEHNVMIKDYGTVLIQNNTTLTMKPNPISNNTDAGGNEASGIVMFGEPWRGYPFGDGVHFEGNVAADLQITDPWPVYAGALASTGCYLKTDYNCVENFPQTGTGNISTDPLFVDRTGVDYTNYLTKLALQSGSPCIGTGPNGIDMGAIVPMGASISGEPVGTTSDTTATLTIAGPGIWGYRWRINGGAWSGDISLVPQAIWDGAPFTETMFDNAPQIELTGLVDDTYTIEVLGQNSAGDWQVTPTVSKTWTVSTGPLDTDMDGMPDDYEDANGFAFDNPDDAGEDADGDGSSNLSEYVAGTLPNDATSVLSLTASISGNDVILTFEGVDGKSYQVQSSTTLAPGSWAEVDTVPAASAGQQNATDTGGSQASRKFYRLVTPAPAP